MNFDNLIFNDLMTGIYRFIPFLLTLLFLYWRYSLHYIIFNVWKNLKSIQLKQWVKSEVKRENRDLCKTKNLIKRQSEFKKGERLKIGRWQADGGY